MTGYRLSPLAKTDLENIWLYTLEQWSVTQADRYYNTIITTIEQLTSGEIKGRYTDIRPDFLKYPIGKHLIFFRKLKDEIEVIRILHQWMDFDRHL